MVWEGMRVEELGLNTEFEIVSAHRSFAVMKLFIFKDDMWNKTFKFFINKTKMKLLINGMCIVEHFHNYYIQKLKLSRAHLWNKPKFALTMSSLKKVSSQQKRDVYRDYLLGLKFWSITQGHYSFFRWLSKKTFNRGHEFGKNTT